MLLLAAEQVIRVEVDREGLKGRETTTTVRYFSGRLINQ